ncbi:MAG: PAS domain S-box protein, partial [Alphaproteobacteria bacterium]|nr:PAS domain S-box protein [Alphaproteobacteria bacterium]
LETGEAGYLQRRVELPALHRDGREFPVELRISPVEIDGTTVFVGCVRDLSARRALQQELLESEREFRLLVGAITDYAIYMLDPEGRITTWNAGAQRIKGYRAEEIIGEHYSRFYTEDDRRAGIPAQNLRRAIEEGKVAAEGWRIRKDGSRFAASIVIEAIHDERGHLIGFAKVTRDITAQREAQDMLERAREQLVQAGKMEAIGQLTGGVAHDFNNLLTIIIGNLTIAEREIEAMEGGAATRLRRAVASAERGAQRATTLTQRLLAFSRRQVLEPKSLDLNKLIIAEADFLQRTLGESIQVEAVGGGGLWRVEVDPNEFESALLNLAINARDAMPNGGKLTIEAGNSFLDQNYCRANPEVLPGQYVMIAVTDNGSGMTKEVMDRAFEPFFSTKSVGAGTGLGLSQVYGFIKQSGGHIKIYSEPDEGTTVKIYLPRYTGEMRPEDEETAESVEVEGRSDETILIVEDDPDVRAYLVEALRDLKYRTLNAADAPAALRLIEQQSARIDLLLSDVVLPGMNGRELMAEARQHRPDLKVLFMTGYSRNAIVHQGRLDPGIEMIQKPMSQRDLAGRIRDILDAAPRGRTPPRRRPARK